MNCLGEAILEVATSYRIDILTTLQDSYNERKRHTDYQQFILWQHHLSNNSLICQWNSKVDSLIHVLIINVYYYQHLAMRCNSTKMIFQNDILRYG